jgi:hypothetical protein
MAADPLPHLTHDHWDRPRCSICRAGRSGGVDLLRVEKLLADRARLRNVAKTFELPRAALYRHWRAVSNERRDYLRTGKQQTQDALAAAAAEEKISTIDNLRIVRGGLHKLFAHAVETSDHSGGAALARALDTNLMNSARLAGEWTPAPGTVNNIAIVNQPGVASVIAGIARVLAPYPEARAAVVAFLRNATTAAASLPPPAINVTAGG